MKKPSHMKRVKQFQHTAARRRLATEYDYGGSVNFVSTHSRPKAAGGQINHCCARGCVSTHSRPKAAGILSDISVMQRVVSTHSRPKAAGTLYLAIDFSLCVSTHSRPKAAGINGEIIKIDKWFQHTAARRRLAVDDEGYKIVKAVSTHSRPKAAGTACRIRTPGKKRFNTQPPEGGWKTDNFALSISFCFNTQPPEGGWRSPASAARSWLRFNTQPPEGGWSFDTLRFIIYILVSTHSRPKAAGTYSFLIYPILPVVSTHSRPKAAGDIISVFRYRY